MRRRGPDRLGGLRRAGNHSRADDQGARGTAGLLGITIPKEYGGVGLSSTGYARVFGEVSRIDPSLAVLIGVHCGLGSKAIVLFGRPSRKSATSRCSPAARRSPRTRSRNRTSDPMRRTSRRARATERRRLALDPQRPQAVDRQRTSRRRHRDVRANARRAARRARPAAHRVHHSARHARISRGEHGAKARHSRFDAGRASSTTTLQVPADHVLGTVGKGFAVAVHVLNGGRLTLAAGCTAGTKGIAERHGGISPRARIQFGKPIVEFEITQRKLARTASDVYAADAMLGELAQPGVERRRAIGRSRRRAARCSRAKCSGARRTRWCKSAADADS